jgi:hypothetical protein
MTIKVEAIDSNNKRQGCLVPMAKGAVIGAAGGVALKYIQPLNSEEKNTPEYKSTIRDINAKRTTYSAWTKSYLDKLQKRGNLSLAEDVFIKTYDGLKEGNKVGSDRLRKAFATIKSQKPDEVGELTRLFDTAKFEAGEIAKKYTNVYELATKHFRPTNFFLAAGAVVGAFIAMIHSVLRTDVKN